VAVIQDMTPAESLRQKQELLDRAAFWTDLAASMSHEVRNPLVAIKTFAQLLPERFDDPDFRRILMKSWCRKSIGSTSSSLRSTTSLIRRN
jgi:nitrogen-specific signal transduction histidine kinase